MSNDDLTKLEAKSRSFRQAAIAMKIEREQIIEEALAEEDLGLALSMYRRILAEALQSLASFEQVHKAKRLSLAGPMGNHERASERLAKQCVLTMRAIREAYQSRKGC
ncbi:hypothetical protein VN12_11665 [Pirellula sp. SH-Sr6A]|uniref:hypothetical protein n=1 Tax=Pirellula sp. SH-Sr6A TaxID=1632865 RepID=UPI00078E1048|nr:hypothetical protein [Pirellula sp. SH-Sr6A]AMV32774.1 hypothetical protein VN12_11665 [Pirellula sp. SH-Sr6A]